MEFVWPCWVSGVASGVFCSGAWTLWLWHVGSRARGLGSRSVWGRLFNSVWDQTYVACVVRQILNHWSTRKTQLCAYQHLDQNRRDSKFSYLLEACCLPGSVAQFTGVNKHRLLYSCGSVGGARLNCTAEGAARQMGWMVTDGEGGGWGAGAGF